MNKNKYDDLFTLIVFVMDFFFIFKKYKCSLCGKRIRKIEDFMHHQLLYHSDVSSFDCTSCGEKYSDMDQLKQHIKRVHTYKK